MIYEEQVPYTALVWREHNTKEGLTRRGCVAQTLKDKEEQSGLGWGKAYTFQGKRAANMKTEQCEMSSNLGNRKRHNTSRGQGRQK